MRLGISMWSFISLFHKGNFDIIDFIRYAKKNNYAGVEILDYFWSSDKNKMKQEIQIVNQLLQYYNLPIISYSIGNNWCKTEPKERKKVAEYITTQINIAKQLGAKVMRVFGGSEIPEITFEKKAQWIIEGFNSVLPYAEKNNITFAMENHGVVTGKIKYIKRILAGIKSKNFKLNFDTGNFAISDEDPYEAVKEFAKSLSLVHIKDIKEVHNKKEAKFTTPSGKMFKGVPAGEGSISLDKILKFLNDNYKGYFSLEYEGKEDPYVGIEKSKKFISKCLGE